MTNLDATLEPINLDTLSTIHGGKPGGTPRRRTSEPHVAPREEPVIIEENNGSVDIGGGRGPLSIHGGGHWNHRTQGTEWTHCIDQLVAHGTPALLAPAACTASLNQRRRR
jgi:hypothetical protein